jgi:hypothetical protein
VLGGGFRFLPVILYNYLPCLMQDYFIYWIGEGSYRPALPKFLQEEIENPNILGRFPPEHF